MCLVIPSYADITWRDVAAEWLKTDSYADVNYDGIVDLIDFDLVIKYRYEVSMGTYSGGSGIVSDPYLIATVADWEELAVTSGDWVDGKYFKQTVDIDFTAANATPIDGTFAGDYDGNGKVMDNITVDPTADNHSALFFNLGTTALLHDIIISNGISVGSSSDADKSYTAILVAEMVFGAVVQDCTLINCAVSVTHTAATFDGFIGMAVGSNHGCVIRSRVVGGTVKGDITGGSKLRLGGVTGYQTRGGAGEVGKTEYCSCSATISDLAGASTEEVHVGGIAGFIVGSATVTGEVNYCTFTGIINYTSTADIDSMGGIVGAAQGPISNCVNSGTLTVNGATSIYAGGILGQADEFSSIDLCNAISNMTVIAGGGTNVTGGLVGLGDDVCIITNSAYSGVLTPTGGNANIGGLIGQTASGSNITMDSCSSDFMINATLSGTEYLGGGIGFAQDVAVSNCIVNGIILNNGSATFTSATTALGGFVGTARTGSTYAQCIAIMGPWSGQSASRRNGFAGWDNSAGSFIDCYWDTTVAGHTNADANATEATTTELQTASYFDGTGFETGGDNPVWLIEDGFYPKLTSGLNLVTSPSITRLGLTRLSH